MYGATRLIPHPVALGIVALLVLAAVVGWSRRLAVVPVSAQAAQRWEVVAPAELPEEGLSLNAFVPNVLTIQRGDSVRWSLAGAHTVTFLGSQGRATDLPQFVPGGPFSGGRTAGAGFFPVGIEGAYDGQDVRSSGRAAARDVDTYNLTFTRSGVFNYLCLTHPGMNGSVTVMPAGVALAETPAEAQIRGQAAQTALLDNLRAGLRAVRLASASASTGTSAHSVAAGVSNGSGASALQFLPSTLSVRRGDFVAWVLADPAEPHTITFTSGAAAPEFVEVLPQPDGTFLFAQKVEAFGSMGGTIYSGQGYLNSGQLFGGARGPLAFVAVIDAPPGSYQYLCLIHREMTGTLVVTE